MTRLSDLPVIGRYTLGVSNGRIVDYTERERMFVERSVHEVWRARCSCGWSSPSFRPGDYQDPMTEIVARLDAHFVAAAEHR